MKEPPEQRFSKGRRVLVGMGRRPGTVKSVAEVPSIMGEFVHEVLVDGEQEARRVVGCDIHPIPVLDADLQGSNPHTIHIQNSNVANLNLGSQVGTINATLTAISDQSKAHYEIAAVLKELSEAVLHNPQILDSQKQEALQVITDIVKQAEAKPEARSIGTLKAMLAGLPTVIGMAADLTALWEKCAPVIRHFFGI